MNKATLAVLNDSERLLVAETDRAALVALDEDEVLALHTRIRSARNKYVGQYRRGASARVAAAGGRGKARPTNALAAQKAEAFEEALARVSKQLGVLAARAASDLKAERLAAARATTAVPAATRSTASKSATRKPTTKATARSVTNKPRGDRALRSPVSLKNKGGATATTARKQAKRDSR